MIQRFHWNLGGDLPGGHRRSSLRDEQCREREHKLTSAQKTAPIDTQVDGTRRNAMTGTTYRRDQRFHSVEYNWVESAPKLGVTTSHRDYVAEAH